MLLFFGAFIKRAYIPLSKRLYSTEWSGKVWKELVREAAPSVTVTVGSYKGGD